VSYDAALKQFETMCAAVNTYNDAVNAVNAEVTAKKCGGSGGRLEDGGSGARAPERAEEAAQRERRRTVRGL
jgi:hypothetical protein